MPSAPPSSRLRSTVPEAMRLYLDHNAHTPLLPTIADWLRGRLERATANAGSIHLDGQAARAELERARASLLNRLGTGGGRIYFTSGATESNNLAIATLANAGPLGVCAAAHASIIEPALEARRRGGVVELLPVDEAGLLRLEAVEAALRGGLRSVAILSVNNETGTRQPVQTIAALCAEQGAHLHIDAAQDLLRYPWHQAVGISSVTVASHKAGGPIGIGALWWAPEKRPAPLLWGGHQERGARPGTEAGWLAGALGELARLPDFDGWSATEPVRDAFEARLVERARAVPNGAPHARASNTSNLWFPGRDAEQLLMALDLAGIAASAGSACNAGTLEPSPVLEAMGLSAERVNGSVRFSFGPGEAALDGAAIADRVCDAMGR